MSSLDEAFFVADEVADFDDVACDAVIEDFKGLVNTAQLVRWL